MIMEEKNLALINQNQEAEETYEGLRTKNDKVISKQTVELSKYQK